MTCIFVSYDALTKLTEYGIHYSLSEYQTFSAIWYYIISYVVGNCINNISRAKHINDVTLNL